MGGGYTWLPVGVGAGLSRLAVGRGLPSFLKMEHCTCFSLT